MEPPHGRLGAARRIAAIALPLREDVVEALVDEMRQAHGKGGRRDRRETRDRENNRQLSIFTLPSFTTLAHLTISVAMNWRNFSREPPPSSAP